MPKVFNKQRDSFLHGAVVYVGRPTKWGNPFSHLKEGTSKAIYQTKTREESIEQYRKWIINQPYLLESLHELRGKDLVCWCAPETCHADVLLEMANTKLELTDKELLAALEACDRGVSGSIWPDIIAATKRLKQERDDAIDVLKVVVIELERYTRTITKRTNQLRQQ